LRLKLSGSSTGHRPGKGWSQDPELQESELQVARELLDEISREEVLIDKGEEHS